jgi:DNA-binding response OmpR family regulator
MGADGSAGTILLIDDDAEVRNLVELVLSSQGFLVLTARDRDTAMEILDRHPAPIDLVIADMLLPEVSGYETARELRQRIPHTQILFMSAYAEGDLIQACTSELGAAFIDKPFRPAQLVAKVREMLATRSPGD